MFIAQLIKVKPQAIVPKAQSFMLKPQMVKVKPQAIAPKAQSFMLKPQMMGVAQCKCDFMGVGQTSSDRA
jgi:hypothetical protein